MYDLKKSDVAIVAVKQANKGRKRSAESVEPRAAAEGNSEGRSMNRAQKRGIMSQEADRIRQAVKRNPKECLVSLFHHITVPVLSEAFYSLKSDVAAGVDGVTWEMYAEGLGDHLTDLHGRLHRGGAYRAPPVRRVEIPKPDGGKRPLGIATLEDKIVQKAVTDTILVPIYESEFLGFNYGFRPGRGAHNALDAITVGIERCKINWVLDADVRAFFDTVNRDWLVRFLEHRIGVNRHSTVTHYQRPNMTHPQEGGTGGEVSEILFFSAKSKRRPSLIYSMQIIPVCLSIVARRKGVSATRRGGSNWTPISLLVGHPCKLFHTYRGQACDSSHIQVVERWCHGRDRLDGHGQGRTAGGSGLTGFIKRLSAQCV